MKSDETRIPLSSRLVGDIAATFPGATSVFRKHGIDFCCGGEQALKDAAHRRGVVLERLENDLKALSSASKRDAAPAETAALIDHILKRYHETHRRELPELVRLARRVEEVHVNHPNAPRGLSEILNLMIGELEVHMKKEELILFPSMRAHDGEKFDAPIIQMRHDHNDHGAHLRQIEELTDHFSLPEGACRTWAALYSGVEKLVEDLMEHIHLENNVLFPRFESGQQ
ncbi:iron-sulfur cluster repair protein YtfE [Hyphococcus luteus]|uniref:Iron-sulfur cluster repair di-iron protein n=1 Tax=Hyphococcus luteus TaxID=2058213 RepID=A0A2S7KB73_9PROT|nr:iron-sulfur cluster repair protein YtfE [Marinicaulis flavus]PQA89698.1 iron-sulfur cluster repair di-iron protein [Marinicaulis flavus]